MNREFVIPPEGVKALGMSWNIKEGRLTCSWRELEEMAETPDTSGHDVEFNQASAIESMRERKHLRAPKRAAAFP